MHQFILNNIEFILAIIVIAQGVILYGQSTIYKWSKEIFGHIATAMTKLAVSNLKGLEAIMEIQEKIK